MTKDNSLNKSVKLCPFCGFEAALIHDTTSDYQQHWGYRVECQRWREPVDNICGGNADFKTEVEATTAWNKRDSDGMVKIPTDMDEAKLMYFLSEKYLKERGAI